VTGGNQVHQDAGKRSRGDAEEPCVLCSFLGAVEVAAVEVQILKELDGHPNIVCLS